MSNGILGKKIGMTQVFDEAGVSIPVTVVEAGPCPIVQIKTLTLDGYDAIQLGFGTRRENKVNRPGMGHFEKAGVKPHRFLRELRVDSTEGLSTNSTINVGLFSPGDFVDITGTSKGRGFAGVVKRCVSPAGGKATAASKTIDVQGLLGIARGLHGSSRGKKCLDDWEASRPPFRISK